MLAASLSACGGGLGSNDGEDEQKYVDTTPPQITSIYVTREDGSDPLLTPEGVIRDINGIIKVNATVEDVDDMAYGFETTYNCSIKVGENTYSEFQGSCVKEVSNMGGTTLEGRVIAQAGVLGDNPENGITIENFSYGIDENDAPVIDNPPIPVYCDIGERFTTEDLILKSGIGASDPEGDPLSYKTSLTDVNNTYTCENPNLGLLIVPAKYTIKDGYGALVSVQNFVKVCPLDFPKNSNEDGCL